MNDFARSCGTTSTAFSNPHGMDAIPDATSHQSTALDVARMTMVAMKDEMFREIVFTKKHTAHIQRLPSITTSASSPLKCMKSVSADDSEAILLQDSDSHVESELHGKGLLPSIACASPSRRSSSSDLTRRDDSSADIYAHKVRAITTVIMLLRLCGCVSCYTLRIYTADDLGKYKPTTASQARGTRSENGTRL